MALSEQEEFELLSLEREMAGGQSAKKQPLSERVGSALRLDVPKTVSNAAYATGGRLTDILSSIGAPPSVAAAGGVAANVAVEAVPALAGMGLGKLAQPAFEGAGKWLMQNAIKPSFADIKSGKAATAVKTMLDEGINPTKGGMDVLRGKIDDITGQVDALLARNPNVTVDKNQVASTLSRVISKIEKTNPTPNAQRKAVEDIYDEFLSNGLIPKNIPVQDAQEFKKGIYRALGDRKYSMAPYSATEAAQTAGNKGLASGLREGIETAVPETAALNARQSELINAMKIAERRALTEGNRNFLGVSPIAHSPEGFAAMMMDKSTLLKSLLARGMYSGSSAIPQGLGALGGANMMLSERQKRGVLSSE
jgi:hypothetical protein